MCYIASAENPNDVNARTTQYTESNSWIYWIQEEEQEIYLNHNPLIYSKRVLNTLDLTQPEARNDILLWWWCGILL